MSMTRRAFLVVAAFVPMFKPPRPKPKPTAATYARGYTSGGY